MASNQADYKKVYETVITPLIRHYNAEYDKDTIEDYVRILCKYPQARLEQAMVKVIEETKRKPTIAHITEKLKETISEYRGGGDGSWWAEKCREQELKQARARTAAADYVRWEFPVIEPKMIGWSQNSIELVKEYMLAAATFQAEGLEDMKNRGYQSICLGLDAQNVTERKAWFFGMCKEAVAGGSIKVTVPWIWFTPKNKQAPVPDQLQIEHKPQEGASL